MFNFGFSELLVIVALALIVLGPRKLPVATAAIGKTLRDLRRSTQDFRDHWEGALDVTPKRKEPILPPPELKAIMDNAVNKDPEKDS